MNGSLVSGGANERPKVTVVPASTTPAAPASHRRKGPCCRTHLNTLWSLWYGLVVTGLQAYIAFHAAVRFRDYLELPWPVTSTPRMELHAYVVLAGTAVLILPVFLAAAVFKVGNLANDGFKLGRSTSMCSNEPPSSVSLATSGARGLWKHCGPTAPLLHVVAAFCLLLPRLLIEARLIQSGFLPKDMIWRTDLDFLIAQRDNLIVLSFMTSSPGVNLTFLPTPLPQDASSMLPSNKAQSHALNMGALRQELSFIDYPKWGPVSPELLNYILALFVYGIRYPAVFWNTNKWFGVLFSFQLLINGAQCLLMYAGVSVLYKVHIIGPAEALPLLHQRVGLSPNVPQHLLLNGDVTLALFVFSTFLVIKSSLVLYLYGYGRLNAFINRERSRRVINIGEEGRGWSYFTHCAALCVLVAMAVCQAPLLYDSTVVYRGSLNSAVLASVVGAVIHLFLWVLLWLILTIKQHWQFKLRVTVGRAVVRSARSIKLVTEVDLHSSADHVQPLLVVGNGRTYTVPDSSPKKAIMSVIQKSAIEKKSRNQGYSNNFRKDWMEREEEQIYWLRPKQSTPKHSPDSASSDRMDWSRKTTKPKVTFDTESKKCRSSKGLDGESEDDGDYAKLRELPLINGIGPDQSISDNSSEENKLLDNIHRGNITYGHTNCVLLNHRVGDYEDPSPLLTPEPHYEDNLPLPPSPSPPPPPASDTQGSDQLVTPKCLRRSDSGMPQDVLTPHSDSASTEASGVSPPEQPELGRSPPDNSETSSGVHSNSSKESTTTAQRRSTSVDDLTTDATNKVQVQWRSVSLQRGTLPPQPDQTYTAYRAQNVVDPTYGILRNNMFKKDPTYSNVMHRNTFHQQEVIYTPYKPQQLYTKSPPVINEEEDVIIRRRVSRPETVPTVSTVSEPFSRSTNMKLTSFTDRPAISATLPHYPTQVVNSAYPHCSTMPLPMTNTNIQSHLVGGTSCNLYPRQHTTIPTHHNGVGIFHPHPYAKQRFPVPIKGYPVDSGNHILNSHILNINSKTKFRSERDSANYSTASSGDLGVHT